MTVVLRLFGLDGIRDERIAICEIETENKTGTKKIQLDHVRSNKPLQPVRTPQRLAVDLNSELRKADPKLSEEFSMSSPFPSAWPNEWALFQINSNHPIEDRAFISVHDVKKTFLDEQVAQPGWLCATVIDGHSGWQTAEYVQKWLGPRMQHHIAGIKDAHLTAENVGQALTACFEGLDAEIKSKIDPAFSMGHCSVAKAGATTCACLLSPSKIICANIGDTMAVLCRGGYPIQLSSEHKYDFALHSFIPIETSPHL
eukprot:Gregarina_sp_Poly_1__6795@NODE_3671_length_940_cov_198_232532_g361_i2_p1_GENE_NODE_3671_length_940_cov_198_232532_g361_i2NODE_3671_length_940_cov_198_232532_g361_i2_p1_ORF_typecomplete_len257_score38_78PP2C/PF00481_21/1_4e19PP2C_2/PF13672_6/6e11_NODE_3671_length_940_cov_198_232532_g361_i268838